MAQLKCFLHSWNAYDGGFAFAKVESGRDLGLDMHSLAISLDVFLHLPAIALTHSNKAWHQYFLFGTAYAILGHRCVNLQKKSYQKEENVSNKEKTVPAKRGTTKKGIQLWLALPSLVVKANQWRTKRTRKYPLRFLKVKCQKLHR